jgi:N-acetylneuraminate synthase
VKKTYVIAEIGINHNGDLGVAKNLISIAATAGFDAVKFQKRNPEVCVPDHMKNTPKSTPWGDMTYLEYKNKVEFGYEEYVEIDEWCRANGIQWSASPWDLDSVMFLRDFAPPWIKIASASNNDESLVRECAKNFGSIIISTGMSDMSDVKRSVEWVRDEGCDDIVVLHCNASYPAPLEELNLRCITTLADEFPCCRIGYSGHEYGLTTTISAVALGARVIERHVTMDKTMWGSDQMCSVEPHGMFKLVRGIRDIELSLGDGTKKISESELSKMDSLRG